jgi:hypothetical protein
MRVYVTESELIDRSHPLDALRTQTGPGDRHAQPDAQKVERTA